jgi:hypothetical protein
LYPFFSWVVIQAYCSAPRLLMSWILIKKCIVFYIITILKKITMVKIYCEQFDQKILLLVKICTINSQIKNCMLAVWSGNILLVKICIINLLINIYMRIVRLRNIIADKNLHNQITDKKLHGPLFIKILVSTLVYCQHISILKAKLETFYIYPCSHFIYLLIK